MKVIPTTFQQGYLDAMAGEGRHGATMDYHRGYTVGARIWAKRCAAKLFTLCLLAIAGGAAALALTLSAIKVPV